MNDILRLLHRLLVEPSARAHVILELEIAIDRFFEEADDIAVIDLLADLRLDLAYYVADPLLRAQDPSYYGDDRIVEEGESVIRRLHEYFPEEKFPGST